MAKVYIENPISARIDGTPEEIALLKKELSYTNTSISYQFSKLLKNQWAKQKDPVKWQDDLNELKSKMHRCLVTDRAGASYMLPGSLRWIKSVKTEVHNQIKYPALAPIPWKKPLPFTLHSYQSSSIEKLLDAKHGAVELCTGAGKTAIILSLCQRIGAGTLIVVPYASLFEDMVEAMQTHFGKDKVGFYGDGKKVLGKPYTVCISKSLSNLEPGDEDWQIIGKSKAMILDETHFWAASSLDTVVHGLLAPIPYRFFFSGTQTRGDGSVKLLRGIIGPIVEKLATEDAIKGGYISNHEFRIKDIASPRPTYRVADPLKMKRFHFLYNKNIVDFITNFCNAVVTQRQESVLILVDEISQISELVKGLQVPHAYAHSSVNKKELLNLGLKKVDSMDSIELFNEGKVRVLIGTSCIATGTNIFPCFHTINFQGGTSEIKTKQGAVGRTVRKLENSKYQKFHKKKEKGLIWDFNVMGVEIMKNHLEDRVVFYEDSGTPIVWVDRNSNV